MAHIPSRSGSMSGGGGVTVDASEFLRKAEELISSHPERRKQMRKLVASVLVKARRKVVSDAKSNLGSDPRNAAQAVKYAIYKSVYGGSISILNNRKAASKMIDYTPPRSLRKRQRGGNRRERSDRTNEVDSYYGKDRAFILRFTSVGTSARNTRYGSRGSISGRDWFGMSSVYHMNDAVNELNTLIEQAIAQVWNR